MFIPDARLGRRLPIGVASLTLALLLGAASTLSARAALQDIPSPMQIVNAGLPSQQTAEADPIALGWPDGALCVLRNQGSRVVASFSSNRGQTFDADVTVFGPPGADSVASDQTLFPRFVADIDATGRAYAAALTVDAAGGLDVAVSVSADRGAHWTSPTVVAAATSFRADRLDIAAGPGSRATLVFGNRYPAAVYTVSTSNGGGTWTPPVRVDLTGNGIGNVAVAIDAAGRRYVAFVQFDGSNDTLFTAFSTDGGASYSTPLDSGITQVSDVAIAVPSDGSVLAAAVTRLARLYIFRSTTQGSSFTQSDMRTGVGSSIPPFKSVGLVAAPDTGSVLAVYKTTSTTQFPAVAASQNFGASFGASVTLATNRSSIGKIPKRRVARTAAGNWIVGWSDIVLGDSQAARSGDQGLSWSAPASAGPSDGAPALAGTGTDDVFAIGTVSGSLRASRSAGSTLSFSPDFGIGVRSGMTPPPTDANYTALAGDAAGHAYAAFALALPGNARSIAVGVSANGGRSFGTPALIPAGPTSQSSYPGIAAADDGGVYLTFRDGGAANGTLLFNRSTDFGATWEPANLSLGTDNFYTPSMAAAPGGRLWVAWLDWSGTDSTVRIARSTDFGATFGVQALSAPNSDFIGGTSMCVQGSRVVVAWGEEDPDTSDENLFVRVSDDGGVNFGPATLISATTFNVVVPPGLACHPSGGAILAWSDFGVADHATALTSVYDGAAWSAPAAVPQPGAFDVRVPRVAYTDATGAGVVVVYATGLEAGSTLFQIRTSEVYATFSGNGGASFTTAKRLDAGLPDPAAGSAVVQLVSDGAGLAWAAWIDGTSGVGEDMVAAVSIDGGANFGPALRMSRQSPAGAHTNLVLEDTPVTAFATAGTALFLWTGEAGAVFGALSNTWSTNDLDGDGFTSGVDCDDNDPAVYPGAPEICDGKSNDCNAEGWPDLPSNEQDPDEDLVPSCRDNCPFANNADQADWNHDSVGDACEPLTVANVTPGNGTVEIGVQSNVYVTFSHPIDPLSITSSSVELIVDGTPIDTGLSVDPSGIRVTIDPDVDLPPGTPCQVVVGSGVTDKYGNGLTPATSSFTTTETPTPAIPLPTVSEELTGPGPNALQGSALASAGDLNGDGLSDVITGAPGFSTEAGRAPADVAVGAAEVYLGRSGTGLPTTPNIRFVGESANDRAGTSVAGGFDFNGDGVPDLLIGAEQVDRSVPASSLLGGVSTGPGRVYLIYFDPTDTAHYPHLSDGSGITDVVSLSLVGVPGGIPGVVLDGESVGDRAGFSVAGGGRLNPGTGPDIAIGAPGRRVAGSISGAGTVYAIFDDPSLSGHRSLSSVADGTISQIFGARIEGDDTAVALGFSVAFPGDVAGTEGDDLAMGAPLATPALADGSRPTEAGKVYVASGGAFTTETFSAGEIGTTRDGWQILGEQAGEHVGFAVAGGGDNLVDGISDLLIGAPDFDAPPRTEHPDTSLPDAGRAYQISDHIQRAVIGVERIGGIDPSDPAGVPVHGRKWEGEQAGARAGFAVAGLGNVLGGPYDDIGIGAPLYDVPELPSRSALSENNAGRVYAAEGSSSSSTTDPGTVIEVCEIGESVAGEKYDGQTADENAGTSLAGLGDVDGSGLNTFGIGAPQKDTSAGESSGTVYVVKVEPPRVGGGLAPVADAGPDQTLECQGQGAATATLDGTGSHPGDGGPPIVSYAWSEGNATLASTAVAQVPFPLGGQEVRLTVTDASGQSASDTTEITVVDTVPPRGGITSPSSGACFGPGAVPVTIVDDFSDVCDPTLVRSYDPGPGPSYSLHGDHVVRVTAMDGSGNAASTSVAFTIDVVPPTPHLLRPLRKVVLAPATIPFALVLSDSDDDGAAGGVLHETLSLNGCTIFDGATYGNRDGLLTDESLVIDKTETCRILEQCGFNELTSVQITFAATDCGGNVGRDTRVWSSSGISRATVCPVTPGGRSRPKTH